MGRQKGHTHSEETKLKMSLAHRGKVKTAEHLNNISKALTGKKLTEHHKQKTRIARLGKTHSEESKKKISEAAKGRHWEVSEQGKLNMSKGQKKRFEVSDAWNKGKEHSVIKGENNPNWKGGVSSEDRKQRKKFRCTILKEVLERDKYTCQQCKTKGGYLHVDHIQSWSEYPEKRFDINNCVTLCMACHYKKTFNKEIPHGLKWGHINKSSKQNIKL